MYSVIGLGMFRFPASFILRSRAHFGSFNLFGRRDQEYISLLSEHRRNQAHSPLDPLN